MDKILIKCLANIYMIVKTQSDCSTYPFNDQCSHHIETSQLICFENQPTGFYMMRTLVVKGLFKCPKRKLKIQKIP